MELQLKKLRKEAGMSQQDMADALGIKLRTYGTWERREAEIDLAWAYKCAQILGCTIDAIAGYVPPTEYSDPQQNELNHYYLSMNSDGRESLLKTARLMSGSPETRIERTGEDPRISATVA